MPAAVASSNAYWISGSSTTGSISLVMALVTCRKRVPSPATGRRRAGSRAGDILLPVGVGAVEIGFDQASALLILGAAFAQQVEEIGAAELLQPKPGKATAQHRAGHPSAVVIEAHADEGGLDPRTAA